MSGRVLLIGGKGYIGSHIESYLFDKGYQYDVLGIKEVFQDKERISHYNHIIFMIGRSGTELSFKDYSRFVTDNQLTLLSLLNCMSESNSRPKLIFPSSRLVYKGNNGEPIEEYSDLQSRSVYSACKRACEAMLEAYNLRYGIPYLILRFGVIYGNDLKSRISSYGTVQFLVDQAKKGNITVFGDGKQRRTFTHIYDLCTMVCECLRDNCVKHTILNIPGEDLSVAQVANLIAKKYSANAEFIEWPEEQKRLETGSTVFNTERYESLLAVSNSFTFKKWLDSF